MKQKLAFITGVAGFAGSFLAKELLEHGYKVAGSIYKDDPVENISALKKDVQLIKLDILKPTQTTKIIKQFNPDYLFHLAAFSSVGQSFKFERLTYDINFTGTLNILEAAKDVKKLQKFIFISSSDCYGITKPKTKVLHEDDPLNPISPYGISKAAAEHLCQLYYSRFGLPVSISRSFNHSGPGQHINFVIPSFCNQIVMIESKKQKPVMQVGDLSVKRDFSDVRDIVHGYRLMAEKGKDGRVYQLCSGKAIAIKSILEKLIKFSSAKITVKSDKKIFRKNDIPVIKGDNSRAKKELGFSLHYTIDNTLLDSLNYWRNRYNRTE